MNLTSGEPEPSLWWSLLTNRGQRGWGTTGGILLRQVVPLAGVLVLHWPAQPFLLMVVVNFGWNWALLGTWNFATSLLTKAERGGAPVSFGKWLLVVLVGVVVFGVVSAGLGFPMFFVSGAPPALDNAWWAALAMTLATPVPALIEEIREATAARLSDDQIEAIAQSRRLLLIVGIVPILAAYGLLANFSNAAVLNAVAIGYVLFSTLCELRPDLAESFVRELPP